MIVENCRITELNNGVRVITEFIPYVKSFSLGFWFNVGSVFENKTNNGITHFIEHMVFKGTKKRTAKKISDDVESLGGYLNAFTSKEHTCFYGRGLSQHLHKTFEVIADMVQNPKFDEKDIYNEAGVIIDELYDIEDTPEELIFDKFESSIFKGHPFELPIIGTEKNIRSFRQSQLKKFVHSNYRNENLYIVASGYVKHDEIVRYAEKYIIPSERVKKRSLPKIPFCTNDPIFIEKDIQQTHILIGVQAPGFDSKRRITAGLISHILGEGSSSRLFQELREKNGIAYQINTFLNSFQNVSTLGAYFSTADNQVPKSMKLIKRELEKIKEKKVTFVELNRAKESIKGNLLMSLEGTTNRMMRIGNSMLYYGTIKSVEESINEVESVTREDIIKEANRLLNLKKAHTLFVGSDKKLISSINEH